MVRNKVGRAVAIGIALVMLMGTLTVSANTWKFLGYDTSDDAVDMNEFTKIYYEVDDKGVPTNATKKDGIARKIEWKTDGYELEFPHKQYERLYLDDTKTERVRYTGNVADWNVSLVDETWEIAYPHEIYSRIYTDIPGQGRKMSEYITNSGKRADVKYVYTPFGFDKYKVVGPNQVEVIGADVLQGLYNAGYVNDLDAYALDAAYAEYSSLVNEYYDAFVAGDSTVNEEINSLFTGVQNTSTLKLEGPNFASGGIKTIDALARYAIPVGTEGHTPAEWYSTDILVGHVPASGYISGLELTKGLGSTIPKIEWVTVGYEKTSPYRYYEVLSINGVLLDGRAIKSIPEKEPQLLHYNVDSGLDKKTVEEMIKMPSAAQLYEQDYDSEGYVYEKNITSVLRTVYSLELDRLPFIYRYTGGIASPTVEWKAKWPEAAYPHYIYEEQYLDGVATGVLRNSQQTAKRLPTINTDESGKYIKIDLVGTGINYGQLKDWLTALPGFDAYYKLFTVEGFGVGPNQDEIHVDVLKYLKGMGVETRWILLDDYENADIYIQQDVEVPIYLYAYKLNEAEYPTDYSYARIVQYILEMAAEKN